MTVLGFHASHEQVHPGALRGPVLVSSDPAQHVAWLQSLIALGFDEVYLHHVGKEQSAWLDVFGDQVLPQLDVTQEAAA
jgi:alkanesulfonate monooxygenase SsuD/methylene tetrahydromethanopterin reductase-like flavin-dependent oxidoreductase (luciferase family)